MALGNCLTMSLNGVLAQLVDVEANVGHGLPGIHVVGQLPHNMYPWQAVANVRFYID